METIGAFEAKTHLSALLDRVERGERLTITRRGRPVAMLVPTEADRAERAKRVVEHAKEMAKGRILGDDMTIKEMIEWGRRY